MDYKLKSLILGPRTHKELTANHINFCAGPHKNNSVCKGSGGEIKWRNGTPRGQENPQPFFTLLNNSLPLGDKKVGNSMANGWFTQVGGSYRRLSGTTSSNPDWKDGEYYHNTVMKASIAGENYIEKFSFKNNVKDNLGTYILSSILLISIIVLIIIILKK